jgi:hypothetical protein
MKRILFALFSLASLAHAQTPAQLHAEILDLKAQVAALSTALQNQAKTTSTIDTGQSAFLSTLKYQMAMVLSSHVWAMNPFVSVDLEPENSVVGPHITFTGVNIHIVDGTNRTDLTNGTGNLIIGYDEIPTYFSVLPPGRRLGSHNLIVGRYHQFTAGSRPTGSGPAGFGNVLVGEANTADYIGEFVAGAGNTASGYSSTVLGGFANFSTASLSVVCGGNNNRATAEWSLVLGGQENIENCVSSITLGGFGNSDSIQAGGFLVNP